MPNGKEGVRVEIDERTLMRLLKNKQMAASELRCLDGSSKHRVWKMCLSNCGLKVL